MTKDDALLSQMSKYGFVLPRNAIEWRVVADKEGQPLRGSLPTLSISSCTLLCTDGIVAYFVLGDDKTLLFGHLAAFEEFKKDRPAARSADGKKQSKPRPASVQKAIDLLNSFLSQQ